MNEQTATKLKYQDIKGALRQKFPKLSDEDMRAIELDLGAASSRIQTVYGYSKEKATEEYNAFARSQEKPTQGMSQGASQSSSSNGSHNANPGMSSNVGTGSGQANSPKVARE